VSLLFNVVYLCGCRHEGANFKEHPTNNGIEYTKRKGSADIASLVNQLKNADVHWNGTLVGLVPAIAGDPASQLLASGDVAIPQLVSALEDESRFVAAHVLLTLISAVEYRTTPWNGLRVDVSADGQAQFDVGQRFELARRWRAWQQATPRPRSLLSE
jgi:hypothetical protein